MGMQEMAVFTTSGVCLHCMAVILNSEFTSEEDLSLAERLSNEIAGNIKLLMRLLFSGCTTC